MRRLILGLICVLALAAAALPAAAQDQAASALEQGKEAFREGRYEAAARAFERATEEDPQNAEAYYLLARVYFETPLEDEKKASRAIDRAIELEPDNPQFLVGRLQQLRAESWNFFIEQIREAKRRELAHDILALDSTNAFAHEELGLSDIRDFWRYRNAVMLPTLQYGPSGYARSDVRDGSLFGEPDAPVPFDPTLSEQPAVERSDPIPVGDLPEPDEVFLADRFDLEALEEQGVPFQDLSARAQRAYDRAIGHLQTALESDPRRRSVYDAMMQVHALKGEYEAALEMLEGMYTHFPEDPETWLYLGLAHYRAGNMDAADRSFQTAFEFMTPEEKAAFDGLDDLLPEDEERRYADDPVAYASRFWTSKDPRYLTPYNERKLEHWARLTYADLLYGAADLGLRGWDTQRGRIHVRYGLPQTDVVLLSNNKDLLANAFNIWDYGDFRFVFEDPFRNGEYRLYSPPADEIGAGVDPWLNDYAIRAKETFREVPERYTYRAPGRQVEIPYLVNAFKGEEGLTDLYVHYGVPITEYDAGEERIDVTANTGAFLISGQRDILVERRRTIYGLPTSQVIPFAETSLWVDTQLMHAPPGEHEVSVEFETASGATVAVQRRGVDVPAFGLDRLALSDVMLAYHIEETEGVEPLADADVVRRGLSIRPAPWSVFSQRQPVYLYFEAYGLRQGEDGRTDYEVDISLVPKETARGVAKVFKGLFGGEEGVSVRYTASSTTPDPSEYQILDATDQPPGLYTLTVRIRDRLAGEAVEAEQDLFLEE